MCHLSWTCHCGWLLFPGWPPGLSPAAPSDTQLPHEGQLWEAGPFSSRCFQGVFTLYRGGLTPVPRRER